MNIESPRVDKFMEVDINTVEDEDVLQNYHLVGNLTKKISFVNDTFISCIFDNINFLNIDLKT